MHHWLDTRTYLAHFYFSNRAARKAWVQLFARDSYAILGATAHAVHCMAEVMATTTHFVPGTLALPDEGFVEDEEADDLGF